MKKYLFVIIVLLFAQFSCYFNDVENAESENSSHSADYLLSYNFDESSGTTVLDSSGNGYNGIVSSVTRTGGKVNRAISFPLQNSVVIIDSLHYFNSMFTNAFGTFSIYSWINLSELNSSKRYVILGAYYDLDLSINIINNRFTILFSGNNLLQSSTSLQTNQWIHFVLTSDGNSIILYLNGVEDCSVNTTFPIANTGSALLIGGHDLGGSYNYTNSCLGIIDEFNIMKVALTADEVQQLYSSY